MAANVKVAIWNLINNPGPAATDLVVTVANVGSGNIVSKTTVEQLLSNSTSNVIVANTKTLRANNVQINKLSTPSSSSDNVTQGTIWFDSNYIYCATANGVIKRVALSTF
jgi:hypothetical protein